MSFSGGISTLAVKQAKTVKRADYSIQKFGNKKTGRMWLNRLRTYDGRNLHSVSGECIAARSSVTSYVFGMLFFSQSCESLRDPRIDRLFFQT
jgi:hypothetical protein